MQTQVCTIFVRKNNRLALLCYRIFNGMPVDEEQLRTLSQALAALAGEAIENMIMPITNEGYILED